ncbi:S-methyl-5'-thioadenosine phosphorylase [Cellulosimicrobium marinum]|uniref:S-methyl-5'-thioadenosine phosphorylase n=1 Tax=Cellulosimicrobium marinum TaxID=1638992 RepID=UPI001E65A020|nr:S-methyl-5'-thioadenosine phosphorylase [Cellulosimicrobium marinum]MCB7135897.1 S-methyl-5'-thioadenosine phosphorylase [Cellulosimicrobium marinum]
MTDATAPVGILCGSGLYSLLDDPEPVAVTTPFGDPSDPPSRGTFAGRPVVFLPRHGADHRFPPHRVNYRANLWALRALGVRQVVAASAVGGLRAELGAGTVVVPDQVVDRTWGREHTVYDAAGTVVHVPFADPYCPRGRAVAVRAAQAGPLPAVDGGTMVVIQGPRFSSRAESRRNAAEGGSVVGMTGMPEAAIARELALCYTTLALVTDADAGVEGGESVTHAAVLETFARNVTALTGVLRAVVADLPADDDCACRHVLDGLDLPFTLP